VNWEQYQDVMQVEMDEGSVVAGVGVSSNTWQGYIAEAIFSDFHNEEIIWPSMSSTMTPAPSTVSGGVSSLDVGNVRDSNPGSASFAPNRNLYTIRASGSGVGGNNDGFHFVNQKVSGDMTIVALVEKINPDPTGYGQVGVMI